MDPSNISYMEPEELVEVIRESAQKDQSGHVVVDVRDDDFTGGNIFNALNLPSDTFARSGIETLEKRANEGTTMFIFHCMMSQQRGPTCARLFAAQCADKKISNIYIYILRGGYNKWKYRYRGQADLIENS